MKSVTTLLSYLDEYASNNKDEIKNIDGATLFTDLCSLLDMDLSEEGKESIWEITKDFVDEDNEQVHNIFNSKLIIKLISIIKGNLENVFPFHAEALDKIIYKADKKDTQELINLDLISACVNILKHSDTHCVGNGIYTLTNLIVDSDNRKDGEEHPLGQKIRDCKGDEELMCLLHKEGTSTEYKNTISLILGAVYQGLRIPNEYLEILTNLKTLVTTGTEWEKKNAMLRIRLLSVVEGLSFYCFRI